MAKKDKTNIKESKNVVSGTDINTKGKVHIGDVNHYYEIPKGKNAAVNLSKDSKKRILKRLSPLLVLVSVTLVGISIKECNFFPIEINSNPGDVVSRVDSNFLDSQQKNPKPEGDKTNVKDLSISKAATSVAKPPKQEENISMYLDIAQSPKTALLKSENGRLDNFKNAIIEHFRNGNNDFSNTYFQVRFETKFGAKIKDLNMAALRDIGLTERLNCICQIVENVSVEEGETEGLKTYTAKGNFKIYILDLKSGNRNEIIISPLANGAGMSEEAALKSLEERFFKANQLKSINTQQCL